MLGQIPDITPALKGGIVGVLLFIVVCLVFVIGWLLKNSTLVKPGPPREPLSGEKPTDYWERVFADIETEGNKALLQVLTEHHKTLMEQLGKLRARLRDSDQTAALKEIREFREKYDRDMIAVAKMLTAIEKKIER